MNNAMANRFFFFWLSFLRVTLRTNYSLRFMILHSLKPVYLWQVFRFSFLRFHFHLDILFYLSIYLNRLITNCLQTYSNLKITVYFDINISLMKPANTNQDVQNDSPNLLFTLLLSYHLIRQSNIVRIFCVSFTFAIQINLLSKVIIKPTICISIRSQRIKWFP